MVLLIGITDWWSTIFLTEKDKTYQFKGVLLSSQVLPQVWYPLSRLLNLSCGIVLIENCLDNLNT